MRDTSWDRSYTPALGQTLRPSLEVFEHIPAELGAKALPASTQGELNDALTGGGHFVADPTRQQCGVSPCPSLLYPLLCPCSALVEVEFLLGNHRDRPEKVYETNLEGAAGKGEGLIRGRIKGRI